MLVCGRRWGKTATALLACLKGHGEYRGHRLGAIDGGNIWWMAPVVKQSNQIWRQLKKATDGVWVSKNETYREIILPGGGRVAVQTADQPDNLRGEGLDGVVLDEGLFMQPEVWFNVVRPALSDRLGWAMFASSPNGYNWAKDLFDQSATLSDWARWQMPSWTNPAIKPSEILEAKKTLPPLTFRQEYGAEFVQQEGAEWPSEYFGEHIWWDDWELPHDVDCRAIAIDPSKGKTDKSDYTAMVNVHHDPRDIFWVDPIIERMDVTTIVGRALQQCAQNNPAGIGFEENQFQELLAIDFNDMANQLRIDTPHFGINNTLKKEVRIRSLSRLLANRQIRVRRTLGGMMLVDQLRQFPQGDHDDGPDALEMGVRLTRQLLAA